MTVNIVNYGRALNIIILGDYMKDITIELSEILLSDDFPLPLFLISLLISISLFFIRFFKKIMIDYIKEH